MSSIWLLFVFSLKTGLISISGSTNPVGLIICSTTCEEFFNSQSPGVAEVKIV